MYHRENCLYWKNSRCEELKNADLITAEKKIEPKKRKFTILMDSIVIKKKNLGMK